MAGNPGKQTHVCERVVCHNRRTQHRNVGALDDATDIQRVKYIEDKRIQKLYYKRTKANKQDRYHDTRTLILGCLLFAAYLLRVE